MRRRKRRRQILTLRNSGGGFFFRFSELLISHYFARNSNSSRASKIPCRVELLSQTSHFPGRGISQYHKSTP
jgi:hypothetical protein